MLLGSIYYPVELGHYVLDGWINSPDAQKLLEDPRVSQRSAGQQHCGGPGLLVRLLGPLGARQAPGQEDGRGEGLHELPGEVVIRLALVLLRRVARVDADPGDAGVLD